MISYHMIFSDILLYYTVYIYIDFILYHAILYHTRLCWLPSLLAQAEQGEGAEAAQNASKAGDIVQHISYTMCHISYIIIYHISCVLYHISYFIYRLEK